MEEGGHEGGLTSGAGALVEVQFTATSSAATGNTCSLNLASVRLSDPYGRDFATSALQIDLDQTNGALTIKAVEHSLFLPVLFR